MSSLVALGFAGSFMIETSESADDLADRLSYKYTVNMLLLYAFIVTAKSYIVGEPIHCWVPAHFTGNQEEYANNYCWVRNTYYVPMDKQVPGQFDDDGRQEVTYYQWMAFILLIQALLFYLPIRVWHSFCRHSGLDLANVIEGCKTASTLTGGNLESALDKIDTHISRYLKDGLKSNRPGDCSMSPVRLTTCTCCPVGSRKHGTYLVTRYIIVKFIYLANVIGQFFALDTFLGYDFHMYGIHVLRSAIKGESWSDSPRFPRVTLCDLNVRRLANVHRYTVQCVLPINLFNEKLFFIMWFWFLIIMIVTVISILRWSLRLATITSRKDYVKKHVTLKKELQNHVNDERLDEFVGFLRRDGLFTLRLMGHNVNTVSVSDLVGHMWKKYFRCYISRDDDFEERRPLTSSANDDDGETESVLEEKDVHTPVDTIVTKKA